VARAVNRVVAPDPDPVASLGVSDARYSVSQYEDAHRFAETVQPLIATDRPRSTIAATVLHGVIAAPDDEHLPVLVVARDGAEPVGIALAGASAAGSALVTQLMSERLNEDERDDVGRLLASAFLGLDPAPAILTGPAESGQAFAAAYCAAAGGSFDNHMGLLLYQLGELIDPVGVRGSPRVAQIQEPQELELLGRWRMEFAQATGGFPPLTEPDPEGARRAAERGATSLLWTVDGSPVAWAAHSAVIGAMARIGPVYTPPPLRGNGYGAAVTAAAVRSAQAAGARDVVLFTDAANPTSNGVYRRLGFVERGHFAEIALSPAADHPSPEEDRLR
jgi:RimJ/RimL family protein N-acetyltransferase